MLTTYYSHVTTADHTLTHLKQNFSFPIKSKEKQQVASPAAVALAGSTKTSTQLEYVRTSFVKYNLCKYLYLNFWPKITIENCTLPKTSFVKHIIELKYLRYVYLIIIQFISQFEAPNDNVIPIFNYNRIDFKPLDKS